MPQSPEELLEKSHLVFVGTIESVDALELERSNSYTIEKDGISQAVVENYTLVLDEYTVSVEEFLTNPQDADTMIVRQPTVSTPGRVVPHGGFDIGDRVLFYLENLDDTNTYSRESFKIPQECDAKTVVKQPKIEFRNSFDILQEDISKKDNFTVGIPMNFVISKDMDDLNGRVIDVAVSIRPSGENETVFEKHIRAESEPCTWIASAEWEFTPEEEGDYRMYLNVRENEETNGDTSYTGFSVISKQKSMSPLKQFLSGIAINEIQCKSSLQKILKHDGSPACVKSETKEKLEQRGWTITVQTSEDFAKQSASHDGKKNISKMHVLYSVKKPLDSFETDSFHFMHYEDWDYDFLWKAARYGATYLTDDEKDHYENILKPNGINFKMTNHKGPSYYEMKLVEEHLPVESDLIKFTEYPSYIIEKYGDDMLSHNLGSTGFDKESEDLWIDAMQKPFEWTEVTERGGAFAYNRIGSGFPYFQMSDGTWVQLYYLGPRMDNHGLFELYAQGYGSEHPLEEFPEQTGDYPPGSKVLVRDREGSVSLTISVSDWEEYEQFSTKDNSKDYPPPVKVTDESMHFVYFDMLLELNTLEGFAETPGRPDEYRKNIDKDYPIHSHREIYDWLRLESGKQYGYSAGGDISPFFEYRDRLYRISSAIID